MLDEEITLICNHCGAVTVKHIGWVQANRNFRCERCGRRSLLDKDRLSLILAGRKPGAQPSRTPASNILCPAADDAGNKGGA